MPAPQLRAALGGVPVAPDPPGPGLQPSRRPGGQQVGRAVDRRVAAAGERPEAGDDGVGGGRLEAVDVDVPADLELVGEDEGAWSGGSKA